MDREEGKEPGDEEDREGNKETKEIKELWDHQEKVASKASWDLLGRLAKLVLKDKKEIWGPPGMPGSKGEPGESISAPTAVVSPTTLTVNESGSVSFQCSVAGNPKPIVAWSKLNSQSAVSGGILRLQSLKGSDAGVYNCSATNILGQAHSVGRLEVNSEFVDLQGKS